MSTSELNPDFQGPFSLSKQVVYLPIAFLTAVVVLFTAFPTLLRGVLSSAYMPHLYCYLGSNALAWTHVIADSLIGLSYLAISTTLVYLIYHGRSDLPFHGLFLAFGVFIIACGITHFMEVVTVWAPVYVLSATIKVVTALASIATAAILPFAVPHIVSVASRARTSEERRVLLERTLLERDAAQAALRESNAVLEVRVEKRTAQIAHAYESLKAEISERRKSEEMLRQSEERFSKAFCNNPLAISISTETEGRYLDVNEAFLSLVGYERNLVVGRTTSELGIWSDPQERITMVKQLSEQGRVLGFSAKIQGNAGVVRDAIISAEQVELEGKSCVLAITQDITKSKRLQAQLQQVQKMEAIGRLAGGMAHDFNNILGVIMGYCDLSEEKIDPALPVARNLIQIRLAAERAANLTLQLLAFSRQQVVSPRVLDLNVVIDDISKMLNRVVGEDISMLFKPSVPLNLIKADAGQIEQVLMNLILNARDAMPNGGEITIETTNVELAEDYILEHEPVLAGEYVMLLVQDNGCGMDEATKARIFEPFFTTKEPGKGTGLGLASVYGIVKQSSGYVWAYSELDRGTTFKFYFPQVRADVENLSRPSISPESIGGSETILLVEDEASLRGITAIALRSAGYTVLEAENPTTAIQLVASYGNPIHLLLTDVIMPDMSGVELSKRLKVVRPDLKVVFISGYGGEKLTRQLSATPNAVLIEKPFSRHALLTKIHVVLHA